MQIANVMVALGGDKGTKVPKYGITVSEIEVLRAIHGADAVDEIEPKGEVDRSDRDEINRLIELYGRARGGEDNREIVKDLFPGGARSRAFRSFDEIALDESLFKPLTRAVATAAAPKPEKKSKKAEKAAEPAPEGDGEGGLFDE